MCATLIAQCLNLVAALGQMPQARLQCLNFSGTGHEVRAQDVTGHAELSLHIVGKPEDPSQDRDLHPAPGPSPQPVQRVRRDSQRPGHTIAGSHDWTTYEVTAPVPAHSEQVEFDLALIGPGEISTRDTNARAWPR